MKIAVIGAGSFVFGSSVLHEATLTHRLDGAELALVDVDREVLELMAGVGRRMAREAGLRRTRITAHTDRTPALDGADFVVCSAARELYRRFAMDCAIIAEHIPGHLNSEFGGVAGISYTLRQVALIEKIAADMRRLCPDAWLLNAANPLPRVAQAAQACGVRTVGFCSASLGTFGILARMLDGRSPSYPWSAERERWDITMVGLNHFTWLLGARERATGEDLLPAIRARLAAGESWGNPRCEELGRETGYLLLPCDDHTKDFLVPRGGERSRSMASHGSPKERRRRLALLSAIAGGSEPYDELLRHEAWEKPVDLIAALALGRPASFTSLNLPNEGRIPGLPPQVFVETPCTASAAGLSPWRGELPAGALPYCRHTALVTDTLVRAALTRSRKLVHDAVELDPTILDKPAGHTAVDACLATHADLLPRYA